MRANMSGKSGIGEKKRRTVTTIETHEVWIVRKIVLGVGNAAETLVPLEIPQLPISPLSENNHGEETKPEDKS